MVEPIRKGTLLFLFFQETEKRPLSFFLRLRKSVPLSPS